MALQLRLSKLGFSIELYLCYVFAKNLQRRKGTWAPANARLPPPSCPRLHKHDAEFKSSLHCVSQSTRRQPSSFPAELTQLLRTGSVCVWCSTYRCTQQRIKPAHLASYVSNAAGAYSFNFQRRGNGFSSPLDHLRGDLLWTNKRRRQPLSWAHFHVFLLPPCRARSL